MGKNSLIVVVIALIIGGGAGFFIGSSVCKSSGGGQGLPGGDVSQYKNKSVEELSASLSNLMLPEEEYIKLGSAILQSGMGLFMAQAQASGLQVPENAETELKKNVDDRYSRQYFTDMNASSMTELSKDDLLIILSFYGTESGRKFLKLSPKIIETTMTQVQADLSKWLPETVDAMLAKIKPNEEKKSENENDGKKAGSNS